MSNRKSSLRAYLAGPFFNTHQVEMIERLEGILETTRSGIEVKAYSPKRDGCVCPPHAPKHVQQDTFIKNATEIDNADFMLAWLDYPGVDTWIYPRAKYEATEHPPLHPSVDNLDSREEILNRYGLTQVYLSDHGTTWEVGYAYCANVPVIGFSVSPGKMNLMLARAMVAYANSIDSLQTILNKFVPARASGNIEEYMKVISELEDTTWGGEIE